MVWTSISEWSQKRKLRAMLEDPDLPGVPVNRAA